ncbi:alpha/beta fold hydrolase [Duganella sp. Root1480D1]|uniref:alpha/beta fold hydrolase n=1 Tax=Duganella sp. Root1480D1 TaxID=1736471 RepID=UPI00070E7833|nr:alpha/beta fold hydrolase [Duganella sp. Root1480D1]KQZ39479.1 hypothetical protein ASD58_03520 [Duganella sp. Root1480D1]
MATIVLVHGILGVGAELFPDLPWPVKPAIDYFNGVAAHLRKAGHTVEAPTIPPLQSIEDRGEKLAQYLSTLPQDRIDIIAHSMGGLDARYVLHNYPKIAARVKSLTTIGTPHHGSAVADIVHSATRNFDDLLPPVLLKQFGAIADLTTAKAQAFNAKTPDVKGVHYMNIAGVAPANSQLILLKLASRIGGLRGANDGVVLSSSAQFQEHTYLGEWPVDHFGEIGWAKWRPGFGIQASDFYPDNHLQRYDELLAKIPA